MSKHSLAKTVAVPEVSRALEALGNGLKIARQRRRQSQTEYAERLMVSRATLQRMEQGDPSVALGAWVNAAWLLGRLSELALVFSPDHDEAGKRMERQYLPQRSTRTTTSSDDLDNDF